MIVPKPHASGGSLTYEDFRFQNISIDSRTLQPGDIFWAIPGDNFDGHQFVTEAFNKGAIAAVVQADRAANIAGPKIIVEETITALGQYAGWYREQQDAFVIGVTGSVGKTTTRQMIAAVLQTEFSGIQSPKNYNNQLGVPLSLLNIEQHHEFAVLELGASHRGDIRELAAIAAPEIGIVTNITNAHLGSFGNEQTIEQTKGELVEALPASGVAVLNGDDPRVRNLAKRANCRCLFVGEEAHNNIRATQVTAKWNRLRFEVQGNWYQLEVAGRHHLTAALCAIAVGLEVGMSPVTIQQGLETFQSATGRCQLQQIQSWQVINDTYNASPSSMQAACELMKSWPGTGQRILLVGDMLELGEQSAQCHYELGQQAAGSHIDKLIVTGEHAARVIDGAINSGMESHALAECSSMELMLTVLDCWLQPGDAVLVKGSRAMQMERVIDWLENQPEAEDVVAFSSAA